MLNAAFVLLSVAVLLGSTLGILLLRSNAAAPPWPLPALHGLVGIGGLSWLLLAFYEALRLLHRSNASFAVTSAALLVLAAFAGIGILATHLLTARRAGTLIAVHAMLAVSGFVVLAAYLFAG